MKLIKKVFLTLLIALISFSSITAKEYTITKHKKAMLWTIDSTDSEGYPSRIYVLGTIHVGDNSLYPVPKAVLEAWDDSDFIYGEISSDGWTRYLGAMTKLVMQSIIKNPEDNIENFLSEEEITILKKTIGEDQYNKFKRFEPWIMNNSIGSTVFKQSKLKAEKSYDIYFINKAKQENITMNGLDELEDQLDLLHYGDRDIQIKFLKNSIESIKDPKANVKMLENMYKAYLTGNITIFDQAYTQLLEEEINGDEDYRDYYDQMLNVRNQKWAKEFKQILNSGGVNFIFAGCGHFSGDKSVFAYFEKEMANDDDIEETAVQGSDAEQEETVQESKSEEIKSYADSKNSKILIPSEED